MRLFISYARTNRPKVEELQQVLERAGHEAWFDEEISAGEDWWHTILDSIERCEVFVFALTPQATRSDACRAEFQYAIDLNRPILPVMLAESELPVGKLRETHYVDATKGLRNNEVILDLTRGLFRLQERLTNGDFPAPGPLPPRPAFPFPMDPLTEARAKVLALASLSRQEMIELVYDIKQVARVNAKVTRDSRDLLHRIISDPHVPQGVSKEAQEVLASLAPETQRSRIYVLAGLAVIVLVALAVVVVSTRPLPVPIVSTQPPAPATPAVPQAATIEALNAWRKENGYQPLAVNPLLADVADEQMRYLSSLPLPDLETTNLYVNVDGRNAQWMANNAGFSGEAQMFVVATSDDFILPDLVAKLEREGEAGVHSRFDSAGLASMRSEVTAILYFVLVLGKTR